VAAISAVFTISHVAALLSEDEEWRHVARHEGWPVSDSKDVRSLA